MEFTDLLEPAKVYQTQLKEGFHNNALDYYNNLVEKSGVSEEENKRIVKEYYEAVKNAENAEKNAKKIRRKRGFFIFLIVLGAIAAATGLVLSIVFAANGMANSLPVTVPICIAGVALIVLGALINKNIFTPRLKEANKITEGYRQKAKEKKEEAYRQMAPLNNLFDYDMAVDIVNSSFDLLKLDKIFDKEKYQFMKEKYGLGDNNDPDSSTEYVLSGTIKNNPFLFVQNFDTYMGSETYTGSCTYTYTTSYTDKDGHRHYTTHTDTLYASITKPKPRYVHNIYVIYGNESAPNLSFSRSPVKINYKDEKGVEKFVKKKSKDVREYAEKALKQGKNFTPLGNDKFEVLFNALDRDNEVEFRLLFTPLAQKSMLDLLKNEEGYGDDFSFRKRKCLNFIKSGHSHDLFAGPRYFYDFDMEAQRKRFVEYMDQYLKSIYFDLAPLLCIPLYQQMEPIEYIYKDVVESNFVSYEHESIANSYDKNIFAHEDTKTDIILKTKFINKDGDADRVQVDAYSYDAIERVEYVSKRGKDGNYHTIAIEWYEYIPLENRSYIEVLQASKSVQDFRKNSKLDVMQQFINNKTGDNNMIYSRGLTSFIPSGNVSCYDIEELKKNMSK